MPWNADGTYYEADHALDQRHLHGDLEPTKPVLTTDVTLQDLLDTYVATAQQSRDTSAGVSNATHDLDDLHRGIVARITRVT